MLLDMGDIEKGNDIPVYTGLIIFSFSLLSEQ